MIVSLLRVRLAIFLWMSILSESLLSVKPKWQGSSNFETPFAYPLVSIGKLNLFGAGMGFFQDSPVPPQPIIRFVSRVREAVREVGPSVVRISGPYKLEGSIEGQGSGVLWDSDGLILTNAHVIEGLAKITVTLADGRRYDAEIKGADDIIDIAVLKIIPHIGKRFPQAKFGNSDHINVGQVVVALGSPCGLDKTATMGIVSGVRRSATDIGLLQNQESKVNYIQTDATINDGNSGGPLVDVESGNIIGINVCVRSHMERTGFTIPINKVQEIARDLATRKAINRLYIGALVDNITSRLALQMNLGPNIHGAIVSAVHAESPADDGGLMENDIILKIGDSQIRSSEDVSQCIDRATSGEPLHINILREGEELCITIFPVGSINRKKTMELQNQEKFYHKLKGEIVALSMAIHPKRV